MRAGSATYVAAVVIVLDGCNVTSSGGDGSGSDGTVPDRELIATTEQALHQFWAGRVSGWVDPVWSFYEEAHPPTHSACNVANWNHNSFYCSTDQHVYIDLDLVSYLDQKFGSAGAVWLLAHEYGHRAHDEMRTTVRGIGEELGADCEAGVFVSALNDGGYPVTLSAGAVREMVGAVREFGDKNWRGQGSWFEPAAHGGPIERTAAFATGWLTGEKEYCDPYTKTGPITTVMVGPHQYRPPPDADATQLTDGSVRIKS